MQSVLVKRFFSIINVAFDDVAFLSDETSYINMPYCKYDLDLVKISSS